MVDNDSEFEFEGQKKRDPEVTLGMASLLGIFFGLVVLCGAFFGFGYSVGKRFVPASSASTAAATHAPRPPAPGTLAPSADNATSSDQPAQPVSQTPKPTANGQELHSATTQSAAAPPPTAPIRKTAATTTPSDSITNAPPAPRPGNATTSAGSTVAPTRPPERIPSNSAFPDFMVQIAAISRPADGDALIAALRKRGYNVSAYTEPQDKLLHVQIGPFTTRADANAMRQKLLADGYNAIIK